MKFFILAVTLSLTSMIVSAGDPGFIQFALKQAHSKGFMKCDSAIKFAFDTAGGEDIRINTDWFTETKNDFLKLTATWGSKGDTQKLSLEHTLDNAI